MRLSRDNIMKAPNKQEGLNAHISLLPGQSFQKSELRF